MRGRQLGIRPIKDFANRSLAECPITRELLLREPERMAAEEFALKATLWLQVLREELRRVG